MDLGGGSGVCRGGPPPGGGSPGVPYGAQAGGDKWGIPYSYAFLMSEERAPKDPGRTMVPLKEPAIHELFLLLYFSFLLFVFCFASPILRAWVPVLSP